MREDMDIHELVPNMQIVNKKAYDDMLKRQIAKNVTYKTALKNKNHKLHHRALSAIKKFFKKENVMSSKLEELVGKPITEAQFDEAAGKKDACYRKVKARYDVWPSAYAVVH